MIVGLSKREYLATMAPPPEPADLCEVLGWPTMLAYGEDDFHEELSEDASNTKDTFAKRWRGLLMEQRYAAIAKCRYAWADAMLAFRNAVVVGGEDAE